MKNISIKITASVAFMIGLMATITGISVLIGLFDPGYNTLTWLIYYNVFMGIASLVTGIIIWNKHVKSVMFVGIITGGHIIVLLSLITVFSSVIASQSIKAMIFRSIVWVVLFLVTKKFLPLRD